ncbi:unnamed protein product [Lactuca saligna]|uniref:Zinc finger PHD-type domain-containing protein n=1 Tax=Lactuca saligna TaxID=75948 RepID=A0AA35V3Z3_LACSI|nr:unnamed protein product [Lactuca saligna]
MNQNTNTNTKLNKFVCSKCYCDDQKLIHNIFYLSQYQRLCTSCVLFTCKEFFCPTCFGVHGLITQETLITCQRCNSKSHPLCFSSNPSPLGAPPMCASCVNPEKLIFNPMGLRIKGVDRVMKILDEKAIVLFLIAAKVGGLLMCGVSEELDYDGGMLVTETVIERKKEILGVIRAMRDRDLKNKNRNVDSLLDFSSSEDGYDDDTSSDNGRMERSSIEGEVSKAVPMERDYP